MNHFQLIVTKRIDDHKAEEAKKREAERERIRAEEEAKAQAKVRAEEAARVAAEVKAKADAEAKERAAAAQAEADRREKEVLTRTPPASTGPSFTRVPHTASVANRIPVGAERPSDSDLVEVLARHYMVPESQVLDWLGQVDVKALREAQREAA